jgi:hypothetical protein
MVAVLHSDKIEPNRYTTNRCPIRAEKTTYTYTRTHARTLRKVHCLIFDGKACHFSNLRFLDGMRVEIAVATCVTTIVDIVVIDHSMVCCCTELKLPVLW